MARRLGRERRRVGLLGRAERGVPRGLRGAAPRPGRRRRRHDVRLAGRERARLRAAARPGAEPDRDQRVRVPDGRADRARAGAARRRGRARAPGRRRVDPAPSGSPRRSTSGRRSSAARRSRTAPGTATTSPRSRGRARDTGALVLADSYQAAGAIELDVGALGADVVTGGTVKYLLGTAGLGFMWVRREVLDAAPADPDRLVRRRGHLRDVDRRLLAPRERAPLRLGHAAGARALRRGRRARRSWQETGVPAIEAHVAASTRACSTASTSSARPSRRRASRPPAARSSASARPTSPRSSPRSPRSGSSPRCATRTCGSRSTSTTSRTTSTGCSTRSRRHRALLA